MVCVCDSKAHTQNTRQSLIKRLSCQDVCMVSDKKSKETTAEIRFWDQDRQAEKIETNTG